MEQIKPAPPQPASRTVAAAVSGILWIIAMLLTLPCILALREVLLWGVIRLLYGQPNLAPYQLSGLISLSHHCGMIFMGIAALIFMVASLDYTFKHAGDPRLNRRLLISVSVQLVIIVPVALLFWR